MKIGVVIPVIKKDYLYNLMKQFEEQSQTPDKILIMNNIDNSLSRILAGKTIDFQSWSGERSDLPVVVHTPKEIMGVNASWMYGIRCMIEAGMDIISILNDDIIITQNFFLVLGASMTYAKHAAVLCPHVTTSHLVLHNAFFGYLKQMAKREGWAFSIRAEIAKKMPAIPNKLKTFCGDDWIFHHCQPWYKMTTNPIRHLVGGSMRDAGSPRPDMLKEKRIFAELMRPIR